MQSCALDPIVDDPVADINTSELSLASEVTNAKAPLPLECKVEYNSTVALNQFILGENLSKVQNNIITNSLSTSLNFLYCLLGEPTVKNKIHVVINNDRPDLIAVTQWSLGSDERKIVINPRELEGRTVFDRTLVHELVHALYQNDRFFINNRDFVIEGMASYFENYYRFDMNKKQAIDHLQDRIRAIVEAIGTCLDVEEELMTSDLNRDFDEFDRNQVDVMYSLSAYYWFILEDITGADSKKQILRILSTYTDEPTEHILITKKAFTLKSFEQWYGIDFEFTDNLPIEPSNTVPLCGAGIDIAET